jgi:hypothetical protein
MYSDQRKNQPGKLIKCEKPREFSFLTVKSLELLALLYQSVQIVTNLKCYKSYLYCLQLLPATNRRIHYCLHRPTYMKLFLVKIRMASSYMDTRYR